MTNAQAVAELDLTARSTHGLGWIVLVRVNKALACHAQKLNPLGGNREWADGYSMKESGRNGLCEA